MTYDPQNVFARILRQELPCEQVFEDAYTLAFMDLMPQSDGHTLVITREPAETLFDLSPDGAAAGQTVPHVHFHVIPRRPGELLRLHATVKADPAHLSANAERIRRCLNEK